VAAATVAAVDMVGVGVEAATAEAEEETATRN